jgi:hypothetical protein
MRTAPLGVDVQRRSIARIATGAQRAGSSSDRDQDKRKPGSKEQGQERRQADPRVRNHDSHNSGDHPQSANALDRNVRHIDQRG